MWTMCSSSLLEFEMLSPSLNQAKGISNSYPESKAQSKVFWNILALPLWKWTGWSFQTPSYQQKETHRYLSWFIFDPCLIAPLILYAYLGFFFVVGIEIARLLKLHRAWVKLCAKIALLSTLPCCCCSRKGPFHCMVLEQPKLSPLPTATVTRGQKYIWTSAYLESIPAPVLCYTSNGGEQCNIPFVTLHHHRSLLHCNDFLLTRREIGWENQSQNNTKGVLLLCNNGTVELTRVLRLGPSHLIL